MRWALIVSILAFTLGACAPAAPAATLTNIPQPSFTPRPTDTPEPTRTPEPPSTLTPTITPVPTADFMANVAALDTLIEDLAKGKAFPGSILVAKDGQVVLSKGAGYAERSKKIPNTPTTRFLIASITKGFTAVAIMMLQEQGKLKVEDKICSYLKDCPEAWQPVTIHHLLTHTSGIPDTSVEYNNTDLTPSQALEGGIAAAKKGPLFFTPGAEFSYSNLGYNLLARIIEAASGQTYEAFLKKNIFDPLQMADTGFYNNQGDLAVGYKDDFYEAQPNNVGAFYGSGSLYSSVLDLYRWDQALFTGKLVSRETLDAIFKAYIFAPDLQVSYGYGWMIRKGGKIIEHFGGLFGYCGYIGHYLDKNITLIFLLNQDEDAVYYRDLLVEMLYKQ